VVVTLAPTATISPVASWPSVIGELVDCANFMSVSWLWQMPLEHSYRADIDSPLADIRNLGGANGGAIHAALFLYEFVDGVPWAHLDIAGVADVEKPGGWRTRGCSGFGARLLADFAVGFGS